MKVYAVCEICEDIFYGFLEQLKIFKDKERAQSYAKDMSDDYYNVTVKEYELE